MIDYKYEKDNGRVAAYDGDELAGRMTYVDNGDYWIVDHTLVDPKYRGRGIAQELMANIATAARDAEVKIEPVCSFAVKMMQEDESLADLKR